MSVDAFLDNADHLFAQGKSDEAVSELQNAIDQLKKEGSEILTSLSPGEFETPVFSVVRRVSAIFLPDTTETAALFSDVVELPKSTAPAEYITVVTTLFQEEPETEPETSNAEERDPSRLEFFLSLLTGQQSMRDVIFADGGIYESAAGTAAPYLIGFLSFTGDDFEAAEDKASSLLYGPTRRLAELFYSLITSSLTAGILLLLIRRLIPIRRPSKVSTVANAVILTATNLPVILAGLRSVAHELDCLRRILNADPSQKEIPNI